MMTTDTQTAAHTPGPYVGEPCPLKMSVDDGAPSGPLLYLPTFVCHGPKVELYAFDLKSVTLAADVLNDLLAACEALVKGWEARENGASVGAAMCAMQDSAELARAAIARAEGGGA